MRRLVCVLPFVAVLCLGAGCAKDAPSELEDEQFTSDWVDDYESDTEEDLAQEAEQDSIDALDDLDDVEIDTTGTAPSPMTKGPSPKPKTPHGPLSILEDDPHFSGPDAEANLDIARQLGVDVIRVFLSWRGTVEGKWDYKSKTAPKFDRTNPGNYDFTKYDTIVDNARARGKKVLITLAAPMPYWASEEPEHCIQQEADDAARVAKGEKSTFWSCSWKPDLREYARWVTAVGRHYKTRKVWGWTLWNEPNIGAFLTDESGTFGQAMRYRAMWFAGRKHLRKTAGLKARIFFADMANGHEDDPEYRTWRLLRYSLCLRPRDGEQLSDAQMAKCPLAPRRVHASGIAFHPYSATPGKFKDSIELLEHIVDDAESSKRMKVGRGVYLTEHAFLTARAADSKALGAPLGVTPENQAIYSNIAERVAYENKRVKTIAQYELYDEGRKTWDCGLLNPDGSPKPAFAAYKVAIDVMKVDASSVKIFGHARLAENTPFVIEGKYADGWKPITGVGADITGYGEKTIASTGISAFRIEYIGDRSREVATP